MSPTIWHSPHYGAMNVGPLKVTAAEAVGPILAPINSHRLIVTKDEISELSDHGRNPRFVSGWWIVPGLLWSSLLMMILFVLIIVRAMK